MDIGIMGLSKESEMLSDIISCVKIHRPTNVYSKSHSAGTLQKSSILHMTLFDHEVNQYPHVYPESDWILQDLQIQFLPVEE